MIQKIRESLSSIMPDIYAAGIAPVLILVACVLVVAAIGYTLMKKKKIKSATFAFYVFISPWLIGFLIFTVFPMLYSIVISFTKWDLVSPMKFIGLDNYKRAFSGKDKWFYKSLKVTFSYTLMSVPINLILGFLLAVLMNQKIKGMRIFRTIYYLPTLVSGVALTTLWGYIFNYNFGLLNNLLKSIGLQPQKWLGDTKLVLPSLIFMGLWGLGGGMVIYLAGLQSVPNELYEAADIDGATRKHKMIHITLPQMSSIIFFNLIMGIIGSFQTFTQSFMLTAGGPNGASMFYMLNLYDQAFQKFNMGYASALAWILFVIILIFSSFVFKSSNLWVYYESIAQGKTKKKKLGRRTH